MLAGGQALGSRYDLLEVIGAGSMGEVWQAWDRTGQVYRAAKVLRPELVSDPEIVARFLQERAILMNLRHRNIVEVHDLVVEGDRLALVMELVAGVSLGALIRAEGTLRPARAVTIASSILDALAVAHASGAVHRDVKPDNVLVGNPHPRMEPVIKLADFGIARIVGDAAVQATGLLGTPAYMSPELFESGITSPAGDVYAVGILLYEMLAGRTPFAGPGTVHTIGMRHLTADPPRIDADESLWPVLATMLAKGPQHRLAAAETSAQLRALAPRMASLPARPRCADPTAWETATPEASEASAPTRIRDPLHAVLGAPAVPDRDVDGSERMSPYLAGASALVGIVVLLGLVALAVMKPFGAAQGDRGSGAVQAATFTQPKPWPIGLSYASEAIYKPGKGVTLTITLRYQYPITGDILVVVPAIGSDNASECAPLDPSSWGTSVDAHSLAHAIEAPMACGWSLKTSRGRPQEDGTSLRLQAVVSAASRPGADQLKSWLDQIDTQTQAALDSYPASADPNFVLQRINGLQVLAQRAGADVNYAVNATWAGLQPVSTPLLSTADGCNVFGPLAELFGLPGGGNASAVTLRALVRNGPPHAAQAARNLIATQGLGLNTQAGPGVVTVNNSAGGTIVASIASLNSAPVSVQ